LFDITLQQSGIARAAACLRLAAPWPSRVLDPTGLDQALVDGRLLVSLADTGLAPLRAPLAEPPRVWPGWRKPVLAPLGSRLVKPFSRPLHRDHYARRREHCLDTIQHLAKVRDNDAATCTRQTAATGPVS
jgi:hypothetical protein